MEHSKKEEEAKTCKPTKTIFWVVTIFCFGIICVDLLLGLYFAYFDGFSAFRGDVALGVGIGAAIIWIVGTIIVLAFNVEERKLTNKLKNGGDK